MFTLTLLHTVASLPNRPWISSAMSPQPRLEVWLCLCLSWTPQLQELLQTWDKKKTVGPYYWARIHSVLISMPGFTVLITGSGYTYDLLSLPQNRGVRGRGLQLGEG